MKKIFSFIAAAVLTLGFTGCEDVPAPYGIPYGQIIDDGSADDILKAAFTSSLEGFKAICVEGDYPWHVDHSCAQVTAYVDGNNNKADSWLISPEIDLTNEESAHIVFDYILRYASSGDLKTNYQLLISSEYALGEHPLQYPWQQLDWNRVLGADWNTWYSSGKVNIPEEFLGKKVHVALRYISESKAATWEVKNFKVRRGEGDYGKPIDPNMVVELPYSEAFSAGLGYFRTITTSGTGEWYIDYSTAKAAGYDGTKTNAGVYYLVSPIIQLNDQPVQLNYEYILQYFVDKNNQQVLINEHFDEANPTEGWVLLSNDHTYGRVDNTGKVVWNVFDLKSIQIPEKYLGKQVRIAFRYETNAKSGSTWEIRNFQIFNGTEGDVVDNIGDETAPNGDFECWIQNKPNNWASQFSVAEYERTTTCNSGKYAILIKGNTGASKHFAYKEIELPAGSYEMSAYFALPDMDNTTPGTIPEARIQFGLINATTGAYLAKALQRQPFSVTYDAAAPFAKYTHVFTLTEPMKVCPCIIINKNPGNSVIMDDFVLTDISTQDPVRIIY